MEPKTVEHLANVSILSQCFISLYQQYISHCPEERKTSAFYLTPVPLKKPRGSVWYANMPVGHNKFSKTVSRICKAAGITGYKMNHLLRVTTATCLFQSSVDEQLIMSRAGHQSLEGVHAYKSS